MPLLIHIAEIAALLAVAYAFGLALGYGARRLSLGLGSSAASLPTIPPERLAAAMGEAVPAAGASEVPAPVEQNAVPAAAAAPLSVTAAVAAVPPADAAPELTPTVLAPASPVETAPPTSAVVPVPVEPPTPPIPESQRSAPPATAAEPSAARREAMLGGAEPGGPIALPEASPPLPQAAPEPPPTTLPPTTPPPVVPDGWSVVARRPSAAPPLAPAAVVASQPVTSPEAPAHPPSPSRAPGVAWSGEIRGRAAPAPDAPPLPDPTLVPQSEPTPEPAAADAEAVPIPAPADEWTRRTGSAPASGADLGAAVAAAQVAVEAALAKSGIDAAEPGSREASAFGKPQGFSRPLGRRDKLTEINGLEPSDESMLNGIGVFHFDQIAEWDQKEILWLENHIIERGRIAREGWQAQAAELLLRRAGEPDGAGH